MATHELKITPLYFNQVASGLKKFEIRRNDRDFAEGDQLKLREFYDGILGTGIIQCDVGYVFTNYAGLENGYAILGLENVVLVTEPSFQSRLDIGELNWFKIGENQDANS